MKNYILYFIFLLLTLIGCSKVIPAIFWEEFESDKILSKSYDHGPWGGKTKILWNSTDNYFIESNILKFANKNKWTISDSLNVENGDIITSNQNHSIELIENEKLISSDFRNGKIYIFETGLLSVKPGNSTETQKNGFILLNTKRNKMLMFSDWGE
ncbi:hypothetical protein PG614_04415 [Riemerella anatipestifer]|nr:hypothetical protein [Riemerella anatipestifer]MDY3533339.1 hypothetical protein [Riemerella anatipestifer]MDY3535185.1 hypothetical protein [Riemerella anatipestifer]